MYMSITPFIQKLPIVWNIRAHGKPITVPLALTPYSKLCFLCHKLRTLFTHIWKLRPIHNITPLIKNLNRIKLSANIALKQQHLAPVPIPVCQLSPVTFRTLENVELFRIQAEKLVYKLLCYVVYPLLKRW